MERFAPALRRVARELDLPRRARSTLLLEMAADLEAVFEHHRSRGRSEADAARRAEETVLGSSEVIRRLGRLHASPWRGWSEEVGARLTGGWDLVLLAGGVLPVVALAGAVAAWALAAATTPLVWALLVVGGLMMGVVAAETWRVLRGRPARPRALPTLLVLAALAPALGLLAMTLGLQATAVEMAGTAVEGVPTAGGAAQVAAAERVARDGAALLLGLLLGIAGGLGWFVLLSREGRRSAREVDALLVGEPADHAGEAVERDPDTIIPLVRRRHG